MRRYGLGIAILLGLGCDDGGGATAPEASPPAATALRLSFPGTVRSVVCNGRELPCFADGDRCGVDVDAVAQEWTDTVVLCQGVEAEPLFAPLIPVVFKAGLPIWTPNLDAGGRVTADATTTALGTAFLSPYLTATYPETARALLAQAAQSPYLGDLAAAVGARDPQAAAAALSPVVVDVLSQAALEQPLSDATRSLGMDHIEVERTSGYITLEARLGTPVDHVCVIYALDACALESEVALATAGPADTWSKSVVGRAFVPAKSYFDLQALAREALATLFDRFSPELQTFRLEPDRVHDIQCYSGALGLADEADAASDAILIEAEPEGRYFVNLARVANLVALALDTLHLFVDFKAFGDQSDIVEAVAICVENAIGPSLALSDGTTREEWFELLKVVQTCAIKRLGVVLAKRGLHAVAVWVFDFAAGGGGGWVGKISRAGMILDRVIGLAFTMSPVQRQLMAHAVDFEACAPCEAVCEEFARTCVDGERQSCALDLEGCPFWASDFCPIGTVCVSEGECTPCGGVGEACCAGSVCDAGNGCDGGECVMGCREECPVVGATRCAHDGAAQACGEHDGDPCLEWGPELACRAGEVCEGDVCGAPSCEDECDADATRCAPEGEAIEICGDCDADGCRDWCPDAACGADLICVDAACTCDEENADLPEVSPGLVLDALDDDGSAHVVRNSLWPERDADVLSVYVRDTPGDTIRPRVDVDEVEPGLTYDVCVAFACDPEVNSGNPSDVACGDAVRTTRDGNPACCRLAQRGAAMVTIDVNCTIGGLRDDSGTAYAYIEATQGTQCAPPARITFTGGED